MIDSRKKSFFLSSSLVFVSATCEVKTNSFSPRAKKVNSNICESPMYIKDDDERGKTTFSMN